MVWDSCNIVLHGGSNGFYFTNDIITGSVVLEFKQERKVEPPPMMFLRNVDWKVPHYIDKDGGTGIETACSEISLKVTGISKATWSRSSPTLPYIKIYSQTKRVLDISIDVFRDLQGKTVKPGIRSYQFHFMLQADLPPTFKDSIAKVSYRIAIQCKNACKIKRNQYFPFTVKNYLNINHINEFKIPMVYVLEKAFGKTGSTADFLVTFKTYRGFAPSQKIPFEAIITNEKRVKVRKISVALLQKIEYKVNSGYYNSEKIICKTEFNEILNLAKQTCMFSMEIPQDVISSTINQSEPMVDISYSLQVKVSFQFHLPLYSDITVTVASTPVNYGTFYK